jgi:hypothetical protein
LKWLFKLKDTKPLISIYLILLYVLSSYLARNLFELRQLSNILFLPGNIILGLIIPMIAFMIGKLRRKV